MFVGGRGVGDVLGTVDLQGEARFRRLPLELERGQAYEGVERLVLREDRLLVLGDVPKHVYDIADPRAPRLAEAHVTRFLDPLPVSVAAGERLVVTLTAPAKVWGVTVTVLDLPTQRRGAFYGLFHAGLADVRAVAMTGDVLLLATGAAGLGVLRPFGVELGSVPGQIGERRALARRGRHAGTPPSSRRAMEVGASGLARHGTMPARRTIGDEPPRAAHAELRV